MTPEQKIKHMVLEIDAAWLDIELPFINEVNVDQCYDNLVEIDAHWDALEELRQGEIETSIPCESSRHYESQSVAAQAPDGSWVGWTYWYGGGKHGQPEVIDWIKDAYDLECIEKEEIVTTRTFKKVKL